MADQSTSEPHISEATLQTFLLTKINSFVKWDLVRFFHQNPYATDIGENIARHIGRDYLSVQSELSEMVASGVLEARQPSGETTVYLLTTDAELRSLVSAFVRACDDRTFRAKAINWIVKGI